MGLGNVSLSLEAYKKALVADGIVKDWAKGSLSMSGRSLKSGPERRCGPSPIKQYPTNTAKETRSGEFSRFHPSLKSL